MFSISGLRGFAVWTFITVMLVFALFVAVVHVLPQDENLKTLLSLGDWQNVGAGLGLLAVPVAFAGSLVAIRLAENALETSRNQEHLDAIALIEPLLREVQAWQWEWAGHVDALWNAMFGAMRDLADFSAALDLTPPSDRNTRRAELYASFVASLNDAVDQFGRHARSARLIPPLAKAGRVTLTRLSSAPDSPLLAASRIARERLADDILGPFRTPGSPANGVAEGAQVLDPTLLAGRIQPIRLEGFTVAIRAFQAFENEGNRRERWIDRRVPFETKVFTAEHAGGEVLFRMGAVLDEAGVAFTNSAILCMAADLFTNEEDLIAALADHLAEQGLLNGRTRQMIERRIRGARASTFYSPITLEATRQARRLAELDHLAFGRRGDRPTLIERADALVTSRQPGVAAARLDPPG